MYYIRGTAQIGIVRLFHQETGGLEAPRNSYSVQTLTTRYSLNRGICRITSTVPHGSGAGNNPAVIPCSKNILYRLVCLEQGEVSMKLNEHGRD